MVEAGVRYSMRPWRRVLRQAGAISRAIRASDSHDGYSYTANEIIDIGVVPTGILDASGELIYRERDAVGFEIPEVKR